MISVYPSKLDGGPLEEHETHTRQTLDRWFCDNVPNYSTLETPPISVHINGLHIPASNWGSVEFSPGDNVEVYVEAKGVIEGIAAVTALVVAAFVAVKLLTPKLATSNLQNQGQGKRLSDSTVKGNIVNLNSPIREIFGTRKVYPDYLLPSHRYFASPRSQVSELMLCVGKGVYDLPASAVEIGDTPVISLGAGAVLNLYQPGANLSGDPAASWWHSAPEVSSTSGGTAGLVLIATSTVSAVATASAYSFSAASITIPSGAGSYPPGWASGMIARITVNYPYTVTTGGVGGRNIITGNMDQLFLVVGALIEITGDNAGLYIVNTITSGTSGTMTLNYSNGSPATALSLGSLQMCIGYRNLKYRITAASISVISVERLTNTGATNTGWPGFAAITSNTATIVLDTSSTEGDWLGPFLACPAGEVTSRIEWDYFFPSGLVQIGQKYGDLQDYGVTTEMQYRDYSTAGAWTPIINGYIQATLDQIGFTETLTLPYAMRPEVRVRRIGSKSSSTSIQDAVQWYGLRSKLTAPTSYAGVTTMTLKVIGGDKIASQAESLVSTRATRLLPEITGGAAVANRNIAPCIKYIAESVGYTEGDIDMAELTRLDAIWRARGDYFDDSFDGSNTVKASIASALQAGFSELTVDRGLIRPVRDEPRTTFEQMYTPQNMTGPMSRDFSALTPDDFDGVDVEYTDGITWQVETVECRLPGDLGKRVEKLRVLGVTSRTRAWRIGMRQRRIQKYRRKAFKFSTEMDAFNSRYLSYCALADDVPGYAQSSILEAYAASGGGFILVSSEPFDWSAGGGHVVSIRRQDGTLSGPYTATRIDDYRLSIPSLDFVPDTTWTVEPPHLLFGPLNRSSYPVLITDISPSGQVGASVKAVNYDARVYADDDNAPV
jgi:hypothetical protein